MKQHIITGKFAVQVLVGLIGVLVLAVGDPLWFGIGYFGTMLVQMIFDHFKK